MDGLKNIWYVTVLPHRINISTLTLPHISPPRSSFDSPLFLSLHREPQLASVEKYILFCFFFCSHDLWNINLCSCTCVCVCVRCNSIWPWVYSADYIVLLVIMSSSFSDYERKDRGSEMLLWIIHYSWVHIHNLESNEVRLIWLAVRDEGHDLAN